MAGVRSVVYVVLLALLLHLLPSTADFTFPLDERPRERKCETADGGPGRCVAVASRRCSLFLTVADLVARRPRLCVFSATNPVVCCPVHVLVEDGAADGTARPPPPPTRRTTPPHTGRTVRPSTRPTAGPTARPSPRPAAVSNKPVVPNGGAPASAPPSPTPTEQLVHQSTERPTPSGPPSSAPPSTPHVHVHTGPGSARVPGCGVSSPFRLFRAGGRYFARRPARLLSTPEQLGAQPWTALVGFVDAAGAGRWICAGALVAPRVVATAAHCVVLGASPHRLMVGLGEHDLATDTDGGGRVQQVAAVSRHPAYAQPSRRHDLALLLLTRAAPLSPRVRHVCLPPADPPADPPLNGTDTQQPAGEPSLGSPLLLAAYDLDAHELTSEQAGRGRLAHSAALVVPMRQCSASLSSLPLAGFLFPGGPSAASELCLAAPADRCGQDTGGPIVARAADNTAQLEALQLLDGCSAGRPQLALRIRHYVPWMLETMDALLRPPAQV